MKAEPYRNPITHLAEYGGCGGVVAYATRPLKNGEILEARMIARLDEKRVRTGDLLRCGSCWKHLRGIRVREAADGQVVEAW